jgi:hypothetical protein
MSFEQWPAFFNRNRTKRLSLAKIIVKVYQKIKESHLAYSIIINCVDIPLRVLWQIFGQLSNNDQRIHLRNVHSMSILIRILAKHALQKSIKWPFFTRVFLKTWLGAVATTTLSCGSGDGSYPLINPNYICVQYWIIVRFFNIFLLT